jgi:peptidoglycan/LPS O-acetylase OafA/YrhL
MNPGRTPSGASTANSVAAGNTGARLHALDAVRGGALVLGILFHAGHAYLPGDPFWVVVDPERSATMSAMVFTIHTFRMTTFFLIAGLFGHMSLERLKLKKFALNRLTRIAVPLVVGWLVLQPLMWWAVTWAIHHDAGQDPTRAAPFHLWDFRLLSLPLGYLWFLYVLGLFYIAALGARWVASLTDKGESFGRVVDNVVGWIMTSRIGPAVLAIPLVLALWRKGFDIAWGGVPAPELGLVPPLAPLVGYGLAFGFGWFVHRRIDLIGAWRKRWLLNIAAAVILTAAAFLIAGVAPANPDPRSELAHVLYAPIYVAAGWFWTIGLIGLALRFLSTYSAVFRYLSDSSYWLYLAHMPLVIVLQAAFSNLDWPWFVKFPVLISISLGVLLISYQVCVRYTFIGTTLNGPRKATPRTPKRKPGPPLAATPVKSSDT